MTGFIRVVLCTGMGMLCWAWPAAAATLRVGEPAPHGEMQGMVTAPLILDLANGEEVSAAQCTLEVKGAALQTDHTAPGTAASEADKELYVRPAQSGLAELIVAGLNQKTLAPGVVAEVALVADGPPEQAQVALLRATLSGPFGQRIPVEVDGRPRTLASPESQPGAQDGPAAGQTPLPDPVETLAETEQAVMRKSFLLVPAAAAAGLAILLLLVVFMMTAGRKRQ